VGEYVLTGPEPLGYADVAAVLSEITGRPVHHRAVGVAELARRYVAAGYPADFADVLAALDAAVAGGAEDRTTSTVQDVTGRAPRSFREVAALSCA
jgi:uncharacterized protein YbjT (DUF2867 family)